MLKVILSVLLAFGAQAVMAKISIGTIDVQRVLLTIKEGNKVRDQLKVVFDKKKEELKKIEDEIKKEQEDYQKQSSVLTDAARKKKEEKIQGLIRNIQEKTVVYQKEIQEKENQLKKPLLEKIKAVSEEISKAENVDVTFEVSTTPILYATTQVDLTDKVVKLYDKKNPVK